jgi:TonB family protein
MVKAGLLIAAVAVSTACSTTPSVHVSDPVRAYEREVRVRTQVTWKKLAMPRAGELAIGVATVSFDIAPDGHVSNVVVTSNTANRALAEVVVQTVQQTRLPRMTPTVVATLESGRMRAEFSFTTFETR